MKEQVLVLGCGPAGLLAAHAAVIAGKEVTIVSKKARSFIAGAQFLHTCIPEMTSDEGDAEIRINKIGTAEEYARKIYGDASAPTSWDIYPEGKKEVWNLTYWYDWLWERYEYLISDGVFIPGLLPQACHEFGVVLSTIPLKDVFPEYHYESEKVCIFQDESHADPMSILYNGNPEDRWYRSSTLFGHSFTEYPWGMYPETCTQITKPLRASVVIPFDNFHPLGRYGQWKKGVLVDDAFREALKIVEAM